MAKLPSHAAGALGFAVAVVVAEVEVGAEFAEEGHLEVELEVTHALVNLGVAVVLLEQRYGVLGVEVVDVGAGGGGVGNHTAVDIGGVVVEYARGVHGQGGVEAYGRTQGAVAAVFVGDVRAFYVGVHAQQVVEELGCQVHAGAQALVVCLAYHTVGAGIVHGNAVGQHAGGTAHAEAVVMAEGGAEHFFLPVGVGSAELCSLHGVLAVAVADEAGELRCVHHVEIVAGGGNIEVGGEVHLRTTALTALGGDDNHTVGGARTVDGCCRRAFEDGHVFHVLGAYERQRVAGAFNRVAVHGHTVDYHKGSVGCRQ